MRSGVIKYMILHHFAKKAAEVGNSKLIRIYESSLDANGAYICALEYPSIVTNDESNALEYIFNRLIKEGLNNERENKN